MHAMPLMIAVLALLAIAYRYYSAFLAARVAVLDDGRATPAIRHDDGQNYHPTHKWVLFGHHFAAISGAGPLIGPVLAAQFGYMPGLIWIVVGVCLAGAVQDFLMLVASMRRDGKSLAQIAFSDIGRFTGSVTMLAVMFIIIIALAGLGKVVVNALGGETVKYPEGSRLVLPAGAAQPDRSGEGNYKLPPATRLVWEGDRSMPFADGMTLHTPMPLEWNAGAGGDGAVIRAADRRIMPGSSWGTFTIACTIPIALLVGLYMYRIRPGRVVEASLIGAALTIGATVAGGFVPGSPIEHWFNLRSESVVLSMAIYGFVASVLPVWVLLCPRDYLSSFLKLGTIALLVIGVIIANPKLEAPAFNGAFAGGGGPVVGGRIFPFLFITIMCGAISGFHALVSSGTTPKMIRRESDARVIGYGAMLMEGLVGVVAMIAAATLPPGDYYAMNTDLASMPKYHARLVEIGADVDHLSVYEDHTRESLRGRTGGGVTLAVGFARIFDGAAGRFWGGLGSLWKYWYHFAIMFEALFILTTIDTGTRIGRFLLQEIFGRIRPAWGRADWWPGAIVATALVVLGWAWFINANNFQVIWKMFGVANQMLAVIALTIITVVLHNDGRGKWLMVTVAPLLLVLTTTSTAAIELLAKCGVTLRTLLAAPQRDWEAIIGQGIQGALLLLMLCCALIVIFAGARRIFGDDGKKPAAAVRPTATVV